MTPPEEGNIVRIEERNNQQKKRRLAANANFTQVTSYNDRNVSQSLMLKINLSLSLHYFIYFFQDDINKNKIMFRLYKALFAQILDSFQFRVSVPGAQTVVREFLIRYVAVSMSYMSVFNLIFLYQIFNNFNPTKVCITSIYV